MCELYELSNSENVICGIGITDHAYKRIKERIGWNKKATNRMFLKVYETGRRVAELKGYQSVWIRNNPHFADVDDVIVYGQHVFLIRQNSLVTVLTIPCKETCMRRVS